MNEEKKTLVHILDRAPPVDLDAERCTVASMMLDPRAADGAAQLLTADDFHDPGHAEMFKTVVEIQREAGSFDMRLFVARLKAKGLFEFVGGAAYIAKTFESVPAYWNWKYYALIVREFSTRRRLQLVGSDLWRLGDSDMGGDPEENTKKLLSLAQKELDSLGEQMPGEGLIGPQQMASDGLEIIDRRSRGEVSQAVLWYLDKLNEAVGGLWPGELTVVAGRTSHGKTSVALNTAQKVAIRDQRPVLFISLEMGSQSLLDRLFASLSGVNSWNIRTGRLTDGERARLMDAGRMIHSSRLTIDESPNHTITTVAARARQFQRDRGLDLLIVDYLQLLLPENPKDPRQEQVSDASRRAKLLAKELNVPVMMLSQINREAERSGGKPKLHHLRESGSIEQDADTVLLTWVGPKGESDGQAAEIHVAKNRHGPRDQIIECVYLGATCRFEEKAPEWF